MSVNMEGNRLPDTLIVSVLVFMVFGVFATSTQAQELTAARVRRSIERGSQFLLNEQKDNGGWADVEGARHKEGVTALVSLSLLNAGVPADHPKLAKAIQRLAEMPEATSTYVASLRLMVMAKADPKTYRPVMSKDVDFLVEHQIKKGMGNGGWNYPYAGVGDSSNTQYALLGLHAASKAGVKIPQEVWSRSIDYWRNCFNDSGGFGYNTTKTRVNGGMTCAGICSTIICEEHLSEIDQFVNAGQVVCCQTDANSDMIEKGLGWLAKRFSVKGTPRAGGFADLKGKYYYLYGLERLGRLSGRRFIGDHDWYREGAKELLTSQNTDGSWSGNGAFAESAKTVSTSFALLFLAKGKRPIAVGKYKFGPGNDWNRHPWGVHYLIRQLESRWKTELNWQTINGDEADSYDLAESPVLFISGRDQLDLTTAQKKALKEYIENGNFIFAEAGQGNGCGDDVKFDRKFRELMAELFPDTPLEALSMSHPIWNAQYELQAKPEWPILGLQACCRTSVVYVPRSLTGHWQLNRKSILDALPKTAKAQVNYATSLGVNVVSYATGRQLRDKLDSPRAANSTVSVLENRALVLPKLDHSGGSDDAPNAWRNVLRHAGELGLTVDLEKKIVGPNSDLFNHPFVFMHGRGRFFYKNAEIDLLSKYLQGGNRGFIFADSICSSDEFNKAFVKQMQKLFPGDKLKPIPPSHPIWSDLYGGFNIKTVTITKPDRSKSDGFAKRTVAPQLMGIEVNGRYVVVYSPLDLSCALENATISHCEGYTRDDAIKLAINVLLYRLQVD